MKVTQLLWIVKSPLGSAFKLLWCCASVWQSTLYHVTSISWTARWFVLQRFRHGILNKKEAHFHMLAHILQGKSTSGSPADDG